MEFRRGRSLYWAALLTPLVNPLAGCVTQRARVEHAMIAQPPPLPQSRRLAAAYRARCPDVLQVDIDGLPHYGGARRIGVDGRIDLGDAGKPQVDGQTTEEIVRTVAETVGVSPEHVRVTVANYDSQYLYLYGQTEGMQRAVPYRGPETVLELLQRLGGLRAGTTQHEIQVIRPHVADGKTPEVFTVHLDAIVLRNDPETNVVLEPFDQIHIGQSRRSFYRDCVPPWLQPLYERICGMKRQAN